MTFELGRAQFILDWHGDPLLQKQAQDYHRVTTASQELSKQLAEHLKTRESDVKNAATVIINEEKKLAAERAKIAKAEADDRKKTTKELLKVEQAAANERKKTTQELLKINQAAYKKEEADRKARARAIISEEKAIERERIAAVQRTFREEAVIRKRADAERAAAARAEQQAQRNQQGSTLNRFARGLPGDLATIAGFGAIASGAILVREALVTLRDATLEQQQAQRSLNAAFGDTQILFKNNTDQLSKQFGLVSSVVQQATTRFAVLNNQTVLTAEQIRALNKVAIDNQAAFGGDLLEAHRALAGAILGETEAYEKYGVVLQEGVLKSSQLLTEDERKRFTTMSESEKQLIRYRIIMQQAQQVTGAAAKQSQEAAGGFNALNRAIDEVAKTMGKDLVDATGEWARSFANAIDRMNDFLKKQKEIRTAIEELEKEKGLGPNYFGAAGIPFRFAPGEIEDRVAANRQKKVEEDFERERIARIKEQIKDAEKLETDRRDKEEAARKVEQEKIEAGLKYAHDQRMKYLDQQKKLAEIAKDNEIDALRAAEKAELQSLERLEFERKKASDAELARIENRRDQAIKAVEDAQKAELDSLEATKEAVEAVSELRLRQLEIEKEERQRINEQTKDNELERLENEKEARDRIRTKEDQDIADSIKKKERALEDAHKKTMTRLEREGERLRSNYDKEIQEIEKRSDKEIKELDKKEDKEDERHRKNLERIEREKDEALDAIEDESNKFEEAERRRDAIRRRRELGHQLSDAQLALRQAQGTGDEAARVAAQGKLVSAIRLGDPQAIEKAQQELLEIVGRGTRAIELAQRDLTDIQQDLRDEDLKQAEDAEKQKLDDTRERIQKETDQEKRQEDERNRRRKSRLDNDKKAEKDRSDDAKRAEKERLDDALQKLERRQEKEASAHTKAKRQLEDLTEYNKRQLDKRRTEEDQAHEDSIEAAQSRYKEEQDAIKATYDDEKTGAIPAVRRALKETQESYQRQTREINDRYDKEKDQIKDTYNNPETGLIAAHRNAERDSAETYRRIRDDTVAKYEELRQGVEEKYRAKDGISGILDQIDTQKENQQKALDDILTAFEQHKKNLVDPGGVITSTWEEATNRARAYFAEVEEAMQRMENRKSKPNTTSPQIIAPGPNPITGEPGYILPNPDYVPPGDARGIGTAVTAPGTTATTGSPDPETGLVSIAPDEVDDAFSVSFGYQAPYSGNYTPGPGWQGGAAWAGGPSHHKGVDLILPGPRNGYGKPIPAFHPGKIIRTAGDSRGPGGNMLIIEDAQGRTHWYLHLKDYVKTSGYVNRGDIIAHLGDTGTEEFPHLHYEVRDGDNNGPSSLEALRKNGIDPMSYVRGRDSGYMFRNPTAYQDLRTGERGVMAERGPELLVGRQNTKTLERMGLTDALRRPGALGGTEQMGVATMNGSMSTQQINIGGDTFNYYGVAPETIWQQWRDDQRKRNLHNGIGKAR